MLGKFLRSPNVLSVAVIIGKEIRLFSDLMSSNSENSRPQFVI
jgi:hypothetical protein